jgi:hypothetical protein
LQEEIEKLEAKNSKLKKKVRECLHGELLEEGKFEEAHQLRL